VQAHGLCTRCYQRKQRYDRAANPQRLLELPQCKDCNERVAVKKSLCGRCYMAQWRKEHGKAVPSSPRPPFSPRRCKECNERVAVAKLLCARCYIAAWRKERREVGSANSRAPKTPRLCASCAERRAASKGLCDRCYQARRRRECPDRISAIARDYHERNRDAELSRWDRWYERNAEKRRAYLRDYYRKHKEAFAARNRAARARKLDVNSP
jgi:hypothetical protein